MRLEQLKYLVTVAEYMSFSKASNVLFLSPQALSRSMTALEKELGVTIFIRFATGVQFTPEGIQVVELAKRMLKDYTDTIQAIQAKSSYNNQETIYLYAHNCYTEAFLNQIVLKYNLQNNNAQITIKEYSGATSEQIAKKRKNHDYNWIIFSSYRNNHVLPIENILLQNSVLLTDVTLCSKYVACINKENMIAQQKEISMKSISAMPFVRFSVPDSNGDDTSDFIDLFYKDQKIQTSYKVNNLSSWINAISSDYGVGLIDQLVCGNHSTCKDWFHKVAILPITDSVTIHHGFYIDDKPSKEVQDFVQFAMRELKNMI